MPSFSTQEYKEGGNGDWVSKPCRCHFFIKEVNEDFLNSAKPRYEIEFLAVSSSEPDQVGKFIHKDKGGAFYVSGAAIGRLFELGCATGVLNRAYMKQQVEARADVEFEPKLMEGRSFVADVAFKPGLTNPEKKYANIGGESGFQFFALGDEEVDGFKIDEDTASYAMENGMLLTRNGEWRKRGTKPAGVASASKPANAPPKNSPPPAGQRQQTQQRQAQKAPAPVEEEIPF